MKSMREIVLSPLVNISLALSLIIALTIAANAQRQQSPSGPFQLSSSTFSNGGTLPISAIHNIVSGGVNVCSIDGSIGGNESPELSWMNAPSRTQSFVVVTYDVTAAFTHWGMYNIPASTTELPQNAGVPGSANGLQIVNDFFIGEEYDGPCPPAGVVPTVHHYLFTVYALDIALNLPGSPNFPPSAETLYHALLEAGRLHHVLGSARIVGLYSTTPAK